MLDIDAWANYCNLDYAEYAIAGPTLDMFVASWNQTQDSKLYYNATEYGYCIKVGEIPTVDGWFNDINIEANYIAELYLLSTNKGNNYWIASPTNFDPAYYTVRIFSEGKISEGMYDDTDDAGFRPVICLSKNIELEADGSDFKISGI